MASASVTRFVSWLNGLFDNYIIDGIVNAVANVTFWLGNKFRRVQTGNINSYLYGIMIAVALRDHRQAPLLELISRENLGRWKTCSPT